MDASSTFTIKCRSCGTRNRIPTQKSGLTAKCGKCGSPIRTTDLFTGHPIVVNDNTFNEQVILSPLPVLLDCWASWCGPCKMIAPMMDDLARKWNGKAKICKLNVDDNPRISSQFQVRSIPTLLIFDNGKLKETLVGAVPVNQIVQAMTPFI